MKSNSRGIAAQPACLSELRCGQGPPPLTVQEDARPQGEVRIVAVPPPVVEEAVVLVGDQRIAGGNLLLRLGSLFRRATQAELELGRQAPQPSEEPRRPSGQARVRRVEQGSRARRPGQ